LCVLKKIFSHVSSVITFWGSKNASIFNFNQFLFDGKVKLVGAWKAKFPVVFNNAGKYNKKRKRKTKIFIQNYVT